MLKLVDYHVHGANLSHVVVLAFDRYGVQVLVLEHWDLILGKADVLVAGRVLYSVIAYLGAETHLTLVLLRRYLVVRAGYLSVVQLDSKLLFRQIHVCEDCDKLLFGRFLALLLREVNYVEVLLSGVQPQNSVDKELSVLELQDWNVLLLYDYAVVYRVVAQRQLRFFDQVQDIRQENWLCSCALPVHDQTYRVQFVFRSVPVLALLLVKVLYLPEWSAVVQLEVVLAFLHLQQDVVEIHLLLDERERFRLVEQLDDAFRVNRRLLKIYLQNVLLLLRLRPLEDVPGLPQDQVQLYLELFELQYHFLARRFRLGIEINVRLRLHQVEELAWDVVQALVSLQPKYLPL